MPLWRHECGAGPTEGLLKYMYNKYSLDQNSFSSILQMETWNLESWSNDVFKLENHEGKNLLCSIVTTVQLLLREMVSQFACHGCLTHIPKWLISQSSLKWRKVFTVAPPLQCLPKLLPNPLFPSSFWKRASHAPDNKVYSPHPVQPIAHLELLWDVHCDVDDPSTELYPGLLFPSVSLPLFFFLSWSPFSLISSLPLLILPTTSFLILFLYLLLLLLPLHTITISLSTSSGIPSRRSRVMKANEHGLNLYSLQWLCDYGQN